MCWWCTGAGGVCDADAMAVRVMPIPRRVFLSYTLELLKFPVERSFVAAAESAVASAGDEVLNLDLSYAATERPAQMVRDAVRTADVHVLIGGFVYGSEVHDRQLSYPEWEFESAGEAGLPRLVFLIAEDTSNSSELFGERVSFARQARFRQRLHNNGWVTATVSSPDELETALRHMLVQLPRDLTGFAGAGSASAARGVVAGVSSDRESRVDALGITWDVHQLALILASFAVEAPLSVALLGDWGTGKSTFLRHLRRSLDTLVARSGEQAGASGFVTHLRQVSFNAWHYSDDHLWVGLVEHLFRELTTAAPTSATGRVDELEATLARERKEQDRLAGQLTALESLRGWVGWIDLPMRGMRLAVVAGGEVWRELHRRRTWVAILVAIAGLVAVVYGQSVVAWLGGTASVLAPAIAAWTWLAERVEEGRKNLRLQKDAADKEVKDAEDELNRLDPKRRLSKLLDEISSAERYGNYRGLVGAIHHDLRRLSDDLAQATGDESRLQRIVLYIDDLDRCKPQRVLEVLQAVNLLLTMDLFMVVVAVDPRWLIESLNEFHGEMFSKNVHPLDYLDKIFHIPFALRPMSERLASDYLRRLVPADQRAPSASPEGATPELRRTTGFDSALVFAGPSWTIQYSESRTAEVQRVRAVEQDFLARLTALLPTPRAVKKLANLYRLLQLSVPENSLDLFVGSDEAGGPYQAAALLLAALIAQPHDARALLESLINATPGGDICLVLTGPGLPTRLADFIATLRQDTPVHGDLVDYQRCAAVVARYGFETYDLFVA
jgi:hypothetical protein